MWNRQRHFFARSEVLRTSPDVWRLFVSTLCASVFLTSVSLAMVGADTRTAIDLVERFDFAEITTQTSEIDFGSPQAHPFLESGWSNDREVGDSGVVFGIGASSIVRWFLVEPRDLTFRYRARSAKARQRVHVFVDGAERAALEIGRRARVGTFTIPGETLAHGWNRIEFRYEDSVAVPGAAKPPHSVTWDWLKLSDGSIGDERPRVAKTEASHSLIVPVGNRVDYFLNLPMGGNLSLGEVLINQEAARKSELVVEVEYDTGDRSTEVRLGAEKASPIELRAGVLRVSFYLRGDGASEVEIRNPKVLHAVSEIAQPERSADIPPSGRSNVVVYLIDTLRADHLGCYGYEKNTSPNIDQFAGDSVLFELPVAQSSWTRSAIASIFSGQTTRQHRVIGREDALAPSIVTLAESLQEAGYRTGGITTNGNVSARFGFAQGFDQYKVIPHQPQSPGRSEDVTKEAFHWLDRSSDERPFFLYLHTQDPHAPYSPAARFRERFAPSVRDPERGAVKTVSSLRGYALAPADDLRNDLINLYDGEIANNDASFGDLIRELKSRGIYKSSLIVLVSDHGEEFYDHGGWSHGQSLFSEQLRVPLLIKFPENWQAGSRIGSVTQHVDILPTILAQVLGEARPELAGRDLRALISSEDPQDPEAVLSYIHIDRVKGEAVIADGFKLIRHLRYDWFVRQPPMLLYDVKKDKSDQRNLVHSRPVRAGWLRTVLKEQQSAGAAAVQAAPKADIPDKVYEQLRALGYFIDEK